MPATCAFSDSAISLDVLLAIWRFKGSEIQARANKRNQKGTGWGESLYKRNQNGVMKNSGLSEEN